MQQFSELIGELYDAALEPKLWPSTLQSMSVIFKAAFAGFGWEDTRVMAVGGSYGNRMLEGEDSARYKATYKETLVYSNPMRVPVLLTQEVDDVFTPGMLVPIDEYHASRYYREYVKPMGWGDGLSAILSKSDGVVHFLAFARAADDPFFDDADIERLKLLTPHIRRAYTIGNLVGKQQARVKALAETFDGLVAAVFLLDERGRITHRNESAAGLLAQGTPFMVVADRLTPVSATSRTPYNLALKDCLERGVVSRASPLVLAGHADAKHVAHFLPLATTAGKRLSDASAAVFVTNVGFDAQFPIKAIASAYALTPREMSVVTAIVDCGGVPEVAERLGLTPNTIKTHLKGIYAKTGVTRQADLVKLVASYLSPVGAPPASPQI